MKYKTQLRLANAIWESLEVREMMSASPLGTATLSNGTLTIKNPDSGGKLLVDYTSATDTSTLAVRAGNTYKTFSAASVTKLDINGGAGNDYIYINPNIKTPEIIHAGAGNDYVRSGGGSTTIYAEAGNDEIHAKGSMNIIYGGAGSDYLAGNKSSNIIYAGTGKDVIDGGLGSGKIVNAKSSDSVLNAAHYQRITSSTTTTPQSGTSAPTQSTGGISTSTGATGTGSAASGSTGNGSTSSGSSTKSGGGVITPTGPVANPSAAAPKPTITLLDGIRQVGLSVNVDALNSKVAAGTQITAKFQWDFGDTGTDYNTITGFNASHVYDTPGTYTIKLTVIDEDGGTATVSQKVTIAESTRKLIYVDSVKGDDSNDGSINAPIKSLDQAFSGDQSNIEVLLKAGQSFQTPTTLHLNGQNIVVGRYGDAKAANPTIIRLDGNGSATIQVWYTSSGVSFENLTFDTPHASTDARPPKIGLIGLRLGGSNLAVRNCTFLNMDDAINENGNPSGILIQNNTAPLANGIRGYFIWGQGDHQEIVGNRVAGSTQEHNIRMVDVNDVVVKDNVLVNHDGKGCIEMHRGSYAYIAENDVTGGDIRTGPLGLWGEDPTAATEYCVIEDNDLTDTFIFVQNGSHHLLIDNNVIRNNSTAAIVMNGVDSAGHISQDVTITNNTAIDNGQQGNFIRVYGHVDGIVMKNNLFVAPNLAPGAYSTAAVFDAEADLGSFKEISNNIWPDATANAYGYADGGINYLANGGTGYQTKEDWAALNPVKNDVFQNVTLSDTYQVSLGNLKIGSSLKLAA